MTRIETFTDAAFAFALTLLVISMEPPASFAELMTALRDIPAFVLSATLLMVFWWGHHVWSRRYGLEDGPTVVLSCFLVFTVLVYVYPLRFLFGLMMDWLTIVTGLPLGTSRSAVAAAEDVNHLFTLYGIGFAVMALSIALLYRHAWTRRDALALSDWECHQTLGDAGAWAIVGAVGLVSAVAAIVMPPSWIGLPGWLYCLLPIVMPIHGHWMRRRWLRRDVSRAATALPTR